jgi:hypothetical protein
LTDQDLQHLGIATLGARKKVLLALEGLLAAAQAAPVAAAPGAEVAPGDERWSEAGQVGAPACNPQQLQQQQQQQLEERRLAHAMAGPGGGAARSGVGDWRALASGGGGPALVSCNILQYFKPLGGGKPAAVARAGRGSILSYMRGADGAPLPPQAAKQAASRGRGRGGQQQWAHKAVAAEAGGGGKRWGPR